MAANVGSAPSSRRSSNSGIPSLALTGKHTQPTTRPRGTSSTERTTASQQAALRKAQALASDKRRPRIRNYAQGPS
jgi:hypothetical protein